MFLLPCIIENDLGESHKINLYQNVVDFSFLLPFVLPDYQLSYKNSNLLREDILVNWGL